VLEPFLRLVGVLGALAAVGLTVMGAISAWLAAIFVTAAVCLFLLARQVRTPGVNLGAFGQQLSFGVRGHLGWAFQALNHRLDVFLVSYFLGTSAVGHYAVGFNWRGVLVDPCPWVWCFSPRLRPWTPRRTRRCRRRLRRTLT
jgi:O-antigen/teichoic acid export membrane protein